MEDKPRNPDEPIGRKSSTLTQDRPREKESMGEKVKEGWQDFRMKVREKWNDLTDKDLDTYQGRKKEDLVGYIGERTGRDRSTVERDVDTIARDTNYRFD